jgi:hypothetical protein
MEGIRSMKLQILKKQDDPISLRISIGGNHNEAYIVYRGDLARKLDSSCF